jgi:fatty-acyl-CoA synthase
MEMPASRTLGGLLREMADRYPDRPAIVFEGVTYSFRELDAQADALARGLLAIGVGHGDKVALLASNRPEWLWICFAAARIGAILCPISTWSKRAELDYALGHSEARILLTMDRFLNQDYHADLCAIIPELEAVGDGYLRSGRYPRLEAVVFLGDAPHLGALTIDGLRQRGEGVSDAVLRAAAEAVHPTDLCYILYTSGSTADPKGVMLQHFGTIENCFGIGERQHLTHEDRLWLVMPLFYGLASVNAMPAVYTHGGCIVLQEYFEAGRALELIERERCTVYYGLGHMTKALVDHLDFGRRDLSALEKGVTGFSPEDKRLAIETLGVRRCCSVYGLTESYGNCCLTDADDPLEVVLDTQGVPLPGWEFKIVDPETRQRLPRGELGLLCIKGYTTLGYYKDDAETARAFDDEGFFITGDLATLDDAGRMRFHSRVKEVIKVGGINVSPQEVEHILELHSGVRQAHVVGVPDAVKGEFIVAFVEPAREGLAEDELRVFVREQAASFKVPRRVLFRTDAQLPRVASGKVPKYRLREEAIRDIKARTPA